MIATKPDDDVLFDALRLALPLTDRALIEPDGSFMSGPELLVQIEALRCLQCSPPEDHTHRHLVLDRGGSHGAVAILAAITSGSTLVIPAEASGAMNSLAKAFSPTIVFDSSTRMHPVDHPDFGSSAEAPRLGPQLPHHGIILPTSGTTGEPKLVPLSTSQLLASAQTVATTLSLKPQEVSIALMPFNHIHGLVASLLAPLLAGSSIVCTKGFRGGETIRLIDQFEVSWFSAVPTILRSFETDSIRHEWLPRKPFRFLRSASSALPISLHMRLEERFACPVVEAYGMTEASHQIASNSPSERIFGSVGRPRNCSVITLGPEDEILPAGRLGELAINGHSVTAGYLNQPPREKSGYLRTGDLGWVDRNGHVWIHGRAKEVINRGGETIAPRDIEDALLSIPEIKEAIAFGTLDRHLGEVPAAMIVLNSPEQFNERSIRHSLIPLLSVRSIPVLIQNVLAIPTGRTGKPDRTSARTLFLENKLPLTSGPSTEQAFDLVKSCWKKVLGPASGTDEHFLDAGGDSLLAVELAAQLENAGLKLTVLDIAANPTIAALSYQASLL